MIDYEITTNFDNSLLIWGAYGYTMREVKRDLKAYCIKTNTNINDYTITKI